MDISAQDVKKLRDITDAGFIDCKKALVACDGDIDKAVDHLRKEGLAKAQKKLSRDAGEGRIFHYVHSNQKIGVIVEIFCETDFVAKTEAFQNLGKDIAMHIAAEAPIAVSRDDFPADIIAKEREIYAGQVEKLGKPQEIIDKIVDGKIDKFLKDRVLLEQGFVKDPDITIDEMVKGFIGKVGENVVIGKFERIQIGE